MIVSTIESRYTVKHKVLEDYLRLKFGVGKFKIIEPDEGEKWKVQTLRELTYDEKIEIQRKFRDANKHLEGQTAETGH